MNNNPLSNLKIDYWYKAVLVIASCTLIISLSVEMRGIENSVVQLLSLGGVFIGIGEWMNHPLKTRIIPGNPVLKITGHPRINTFGGNMLNILGGALILVGIIRLLP